MISKPIISATCSFWLILSSSKWCIIVQVQTQTSEIGQAFQSPNCFQRQAAPNCFCKTNCICSSLSCLRTWRRSVLHLSVLRIRINHSQLHQSLNFGFRQGSCSIQTECLPNVLYVYKHIGSSVLTFLKHVYSITVSGNRLLLYFGLFLW